MTDNIGNKKRAKTRERAEDHARRIAKTHNGDTHNDTRRNTHGAPSEGPDEGEKERRVGNGDGDSQAREEPEGGGGTTASTGPPRRRGKEASRTPRPGTGEAGRCKGAQQNRCNSTQFYKQYIQSPMCTMERT